MHRDFTSLQKLNKKEMLRNFKLRTIPKLATRNQLNEVKIKSPNLKFCRNRLNQIDEPERDDGYNLDFHGGQQIHKQNP